MLTRLDIGNSLLGTERKVTGRDAKCFHKDGQSRDASGLTAGLCDTTRGSKCSVPSHRVALGGQRVNGKLHASHNLLSTTKCREFNNWEALNICSLGSSFCARNPS